MSTATQSIAGGLEGITPKRLFAGSCFSLIATAVTFAVVAGIMGALKTQFKLSNEDVGWIAGAATWGFTISIFVLGPLVDVLGMRLLMRFALLCHVAGVLLMMFATGFAMLFFGGLIISLGNGTVEAVCNPMIATIYPDEKTKKLNHFHMWFPGGIVIGAVLAFLMDKAGIGYWQAKLVLILIPAFIYGVLFTGQRFPKTERVQSGISFGGMVKATFLRPLFLVLFVCMMITASLELGPNRWVPSVLEAGGVAGILVLAYINGIMAILRGFAGPVVHRLSNTGVLVISAVLAGVGLLWLSYAETTVVAFAAATVFALGVCYFWPTMLGTAAERVPKGGSLALAMLGGIGMLIVGVVTTPQMGRIADGYLYQKLTADNATVGRTAAVLIDITNTYPPYAQTKQDEVFKKEILSATGDSAKAIDLFKETGKLPYQVKVGDGKVVVDTAEALRSAIKNGPPDSVKASGTAEEKAALSAKEAAAGILNPADNYGGRMSFQRVAPFALILVVVFGVLYLMDRKKGGYKAEKILSTGLAEGHADGVPPGQLK